VCTNIGSTKPVKSIYFLTVRTRKGDFVCGSQDSLNFSWNFLSPLSLPVSLVDSSPALFFAHAFMSSSSTPIPDTAGAARVKAGNNIFTSDGSFLDRFKKLKGDEEEKKKVQDSLTRYV
jgi:hypothetical protein